jgi:hypothetical protein
MPARAPRRAIARLALLGASAALTMGACAGPPASPTPVPAGSDSKIEARSAGAFSTVSVDGPLNLVLAVGSVPSVTVEAPSNVLPLVKTDVAGDELDVTVAPPGFASAKPVTVRVTSSTVGSLSLSGGATGALEVKQMAMTVSVSGGSMLKGIGSVSQLTVTVLGNSTAELGDLVADTAMISAAGGAKATIRAVRQLTGTIDSGAILTLAVVPAAKSVAVTGGAQIVLP